MTRLLTLWTRRRAAAGRRPTELPDVEPPELVSPSGWYESSMDLERGLTVLEVEPDTGPETSPFTYQLEEVR